MSFPTKIPLKTKKITSKSTENQSEYTDSLSNLIDQQNLVTKRNPKERNWKIYWLRKAGGFWHILESREIEKLTRLWDVE
jgi:hypothetical protein